MIRLFKRKTDTQIIKSIPQYKQYYKPKFLSLINELSFNENDIKQIHIIHNKPSYGTTIPIVEDGKLQFIIELSDDILIYISNTQNSLEKLKSKSVFQHEICHCIEIKNLFDKSILNVPKLFDDKIPINTTYNFIYSEAVNIWSEFFACYHNRIYNEWHEIPDVKLDIKQLLKWIDATIYLLNDNVDIRLCEDMMKFMHEFWYHMVSLIAIHLHNNKNLLIDDYLTSGNPTITKYFHYIYNYLKTNIEFYPHWLSEDNYIKFGKALMKILELNGITYSTNDLSDNFIFKSIE